MDIVPSLRLSAPGELRADRSEALRYLGYGKTSPDEAVLELLEACEKELLDACQGRACWAKVPVNFPSEHSVDLGFGPIESVSLAKHLKGCHSALLFAASMALLCKRKKGKYEKEK